MGDFEVAIRGLSHAYHRYHNYLLLGSLQLFLFLPCGISLMQRPIHGHLLADLDDIIELIKHIFPFVFVCHFRRYVCQQFKALFEGNYELFIDRFKGLHVFSSLFRGGFHVFEGLFVGVGFQCELI